MPNVNTLNRLLAAKTCDRFMRSQLGVPALMISMEADQLF